MFSEPIESIFNQFVTINDKIMLKLTAKNSYINEILHEINDFKVQRTFVDCKLVCQGGVVQCHAAMLQYANIWWVNCRNSDIDECVIIIPVMTVSEGSNLVGGYTLIYIFVSSSVPAQLGNTRYCWSCMEQMKALAVCCWS